MDTLWYDGPSGSEHVPNPTAEWMFGCMRLDYAGNWGPYSPVGVLAWHTHASQKVLTRIGLGTATERQQLLFVRHPTRGWYFEYSTHNLPRRRWVVPLDPDIDRDRYVKHWAYGEQLYFLAASFVPQSTAERIVAAFVQNRSTSRVVKWASFNRIHPRLDSDGYREHRQRVRERTEPS